MSALQGTVARKIQFVGVGLHSGKLVNLEVIPAEPDFGIRFLRTDIESAIPIHGRPDNISGTQLCTTLGDGETSVSTVEHLMAAFGGFGVDNALVRVSDKEVPILDGSSAPFVDKLNEVGVQVQNVPKRAMKLRSAVRVDFEDQFMEYRPLDLVSGDASLHIHYSIEFLDSKAIGVQNYSIDLTRANFMEICEARTFCHIDTVSSMRSNGLALGGSLDNAIVVNEDRVINADGLRYDDEFVRHKVLDCIGDLALLGHQLVGSVRVHKGGHRIHAAFIKELYQRWLSENQQSSSEEPYPSSQRRLAAL